MPHTKIYPLKFSRVKLNSCARTEAYEIGVSAYLVGFDAGLDSLLLDYEHEDEYSEVFKHVEYHKKKMRKHLRGEKQ